MGCFALCRFVFNFSELRLTVISTLRPVSPDHTRCRRYQNCPLNVTWLTSSSRFTDRGCRLAAEEVTTMRKRCAADVGGALTRRTSNVTIRRWRRPEWIACMNTTIKCRRQNRRDIPLSQKVCRLFACYQLVIYSVCECDESTTVARRCITKRRASPSENKSYRHRLKWSAN